MDDQQRVAFINSQVACMNAELEGMKAENMGRKVLNESMAYTGKDFQALPDIYGLGHNEVIAYLEGY